MCAIYKIFKNLKIIITTKRELGCVCLLVFVYYHTTFHSYGDITITDERLQILTYARHSWPLSIEGSLACHNYCDTEHPFIMVISKDPWHSHLLPSVCSWAVTTCFYDLDLSWLGFEHQAFRLSQPHCATAEVLGYVGHNTFDLVAQLYNAAMEQSVIVCISHAEGWWCSIPVAKDLKMALYTNGSTLYEPTSYMAILNILLNCLYPNDLSYISVSHWSEALSRQP